MFKKIIKSYDYSLIIVYILLTLFGLIMIYSSSYVWAIQRYDYPADYFYQRQQTNLLIAFSMFLIFSFLPYKIFRQKQILIPLTLLSLGGLIAVQLFGQITNNAQSWIHLGVRKIQPSEFVKLTVIIYLSAVFANKQKYINQLNNGILPPFLYLLIVCFFIKIEPDNGTALITFAIGLVIILCSGMRIKTIMKLMLIGLIVILALTPFVISKFDSIVTEGNMKRIVGYLEPFENFQDEGYHLVNSYLAIGAGGLKGLGLGQSIQKFGYLPEPHTDFIMAIISEELGLIGVSIVILGLAYIVLKGIYIGIKCRDSFGSMLAIGIASMIGIQAFINLGGVSGLIPITGVPLPFISYGGSSILVLSIAMGLLVNVSMFTNFERKYAQKKNKTETVPWTPSYRNGGKNLQRIY